MSNIPYTYEVHLSLEVQRWISELPTDIRLNIKRRLHNLTIGYFGDFKRFDGLIELRWRNGYRIYGFLWKNSIFITNGGTKNGQKKDIKKAQRFKQDYIR